MRRKIARCLILGIFCIVLTSSVLAKNMRSMEERDLSDSEWRDPQNTQGSQTRHGSQQNPSYQQRASRANIGGRLGQNYMNNRVNNRYGQSPMNYGQYQGRNGLGQNY